MKQVVVCSGLIILSLLTYTIFSRLSADAIGMAVGLVFGLLAAIPTLLLLLLSQRQERRYHDDEPQEPRLPAHPPVVVVLPPPAPRVEQHYHYHAAPAVPTQAQPRALPGPHLAGADTYATPRAAIVTVWPEPAQWEGEE